MANVFRITPAGVGNTTLTVVYTKNGVTATGTSGTFTVSKASDAGLTYITVQGSELTYNGNQQVIASAKTHGTSVAYIGYKKGSKATADSQITWTTVAPGSTATQLKATDAGIYYLYKKWTADDNHSNNQTYTPLVSGDDEEWSFEIQQAYAAPTFNNSSVSATLAPTAATTSPAVNCGAFTSATAGHSGSITYSIISVNGGAVGNWSMTSNTSRVITVPASTAGGTYTIVVRATENDTGNYSSSYKDATITVTVNKKTGQTAPTATGNSSTYATSGSISGSASGGGGIGTLYYRSDTAGGTNYGTATTTAPSRSRSSVGTTSFIAYWGGNNYWAASGNSSQAKLIISPADAPPTFSDQSLSVMLAPTAATTSPAVNCSAFTAATAGHGGSITYSIISVNGGSVGSWSMTSNTSRVITVPASTAGGTYYIVVRATEAGNSNYNQGTKDATITLTINKKTGQNAPTATGATSTYASSGSISGSASGGGGIGPLYYRSDTAGGTNYGTATTSAPSRNRNSVGTTSFIAYWGGNDYWAPSSNSSQAKLIVNQAEGAKPTFSDQTLSVSLVPTAATTSPAVNCGAFTAATAGHSGSITYSIQSVNGGAVGSWSMTTNTSRIITVPASTAGGTYTIVIRANEGATTNYTSSYKDATITLTVNKKAQDAPTASGNTTTYASSGSISGSASGGGGIGSLYYRSDTAGGTNYGTATTTAPSRNRNSVGTTSFIAYWSGNDYWAQSNNSGQAKLIVNQAEGPKPTFNDQTLSVTLAPTAATTSPAVNCGTFTAATAGHSGSITYSIQSVNGGAVGSWSMTTNTSRIITVPASTAGGTYNIVVRANEGATTNYTSSYKDATITLTVNKKAQDVPTATGASTTYASTGSISGSASGGGGIGTLYYRSDTAGGTNYGTATTSTPSRNRNSVGTTSFIAYWSGNDYWAQSNNSSQAKLIVDKASIDPTFSNQSLSVTLAPTAATTSPAVNCSAFTAATAGHGGSITYTIISVNGSSTIGNWSMTSNTSRVITVPASTAGGTYTIGVRATESGDGNYYSTYKDATITITVNKKTGQTPPTTTGATSTYATSGSISGSASGGGGIGTLYYKIDTSGGTNYGSATTTAPSRSRSSVGTTSFIAYWGGNDYWTASGNSGQAKLIINPADAPPTFSNQSLSVTLAPTAATTSPAVNCSAFTAATAGHSGSITYSIISVNGGSVGSWSMTTNTSRIITVPASTAGGTYNIVVRATEAGNSNYNEGTKDATITLTVNKKSQTAPTASGNSSTYATSGSISGSASGGGGIGSLYYRSDTAGGTNYGTATTTAPSRARSSVGTTSFIAYWGGNDYWAQSNNSGQAKLIIGQATGTISYTLQNQSIYCTTSASAKSSTDAAKTVTIATSAATTNTGQTVVYTMTVKNSSNETVSNWTLSNGTTITIPSGTAAGTYTVSIDASVAASTNYTAASTNPDPTATVTITSVTLSSVTLTLRDATIQYNATKNLVSSTPVNSDCVSEVKATYNNGAYKDVKSSAIYTAADPSIITIEN